MNPKTQSLRLFGAAGQIEALMDEPVLAEGAVTTVEDVTPTQHFTEPPPRFTEAPKFVL